MTSGLPQLHSSPPDKHPDHRMSKHPDHQRSNNTDHQRSNHPDPMELDDNIQQTHMGENSIKAFPDTDLSNMPQKLVQDLHAFSAPRCQVM